MPLSRISFRNAIFLAIAFFCLTLYAEASDTKMQEVREETDAERTGPFWHEGACSRSLSRQARQIIQELIVPEFEWASLDMPVSCPLHPTLDIYAVQETHKNRLRTHHWQCGYCNKNFKSEAFLDRHLTRRHEHEGTENASVCLGSYCDILGCEGETDEESNNGDIGSIETTPIAQQRVCEPKEMEARKQACKIVMNKCVPPQSSTAMRKLNDKLVGLICNGLACTPDGRRILLRPTIAELETSRHWNKAYWALMAVVAVLITLFYAAIYSYSREIQPSGLQRIRRHHHHNNQGFSRWMFCCFRTRKTEKIF